MYFKIKSTIRDTDVYYIIVNVKITIRCKNYIKNSKHVYTY